MTVTALSGFLCSQRPLPSIRLLFASFKAFLTLSTKAPAILGYGASVYCTS